MSLSGINLNPDMDFFIGALLMKIRPLHDRVIVKRKEVEAKSAGGIVTFCQKNGRYSDFQPYYSVGYSVNPLYAETRLQMLFHFD